MKDDDYLLENAYEISITYDVTNVTQTSYHDIWFEDNPLDKLD